MSRRIVKILQLSRYKTRFATEGPPSLQLCLLLRSGENPVPRSRSSGGELRSDEMRALLCRLRQIHNTELPTSSIARPLRTWGVNPRVANSAVVSPHASLRNGSFVMSQIGGVRCMGIGSHKEGNRAGQHGVRHPNLKPDGSPEKEKAVATEQFLEKAKEESASVDEAQEQSMTNTELQFGVKDGKNINEAISHASEELIERTTIHERN